FRDEQQRTVQGLALRLAFEEGWPARPWPSVRRGFQGIRTDRNRAARYRRRGPCHDHPDADVDLAGLDGCLPADRKRASEVGGPVRQRDYVNVACWVASIGALSKTHGVSRLGSWWQEQEASVVVESP